MEKKAVAGNVAMDKTLDVLIYESSYFSARKLGLSASLSHDLASMVEDNLKANCGGASVYVAAPNKAVRDMRILNAKMNGSTVSQIAQFEKLTERQVYRVIKRLEG